MFILQNDTFKFCRWDIEGWILLHPGLRYYATMRSESIHLIEKKGESSHTHVTPTSESANNRRSVINGWPVHADESGDRLAWNLPDELFSQLSWSTGPWIRETRKSWSGLLIFLRRTLHFGPQHPLRLLLLQCCLLPASSPTLVAYNDILLFFYGAQGG